MVAELLERTTELAGELKYYFPNKSVTIVQSGDLPLNKVYAPQFRRAVDVRIRARGVELVFGEHLDETVPKDGMVTTRSGRKIPADLVVSSTGGTPATGFLSNIMPSILIPSGRVRTEHTLQVMSHPDIFCIGDAVDTEERPGLGKYQKHSKVVCANVLARVRGEPAKAVYGGSIETIGISMGKTGGAGYIGVLWGLVCPNWLIWFAKARTLGTRAARVHMGYGLMDSLRGTPISESPFTTVLRGAEGAAAAA
ncbi:hypothetical protein EVG20_g11195 [Dentipellis fragilis]|uniref:FAD/NAD(P)-binding domain-containing protein n=1 Tax=Dentipellis fragilis TaxID=205917 RepID=A0A4Y9XNU4_9AGAM|nr:hypothetical protein EVG20_g11195 [Dentipellis fragilis]